MLEISEAFKNAIQADSRTLDVRMLASTDNKGGSLVDIDARVRTLLYSASSVEGDTVSIGGAISCSIQVVMEKPEMDITGKELTVSIGVLSNGTYVHCPLGIFTPEKIQNDDGIISFTAYDRMQTKLSKRLDFAIPANIDIKDVYMTDEVFGHRSGVPVSPNILKLENGVMTTKRCEFRTFRDMLSCFAQLYGAYAIIDRYGRVDFRWYDTAKISVYPVLPSRYYDDFKEDSSEFSFGSIECETGTGAIIAGTAEPKISIENPYMTQERLNTVYNQVRDFTFTPSSVSFLGDPRIEVGDIVELKDKYGTIHDIPVMKLTFDYDGGLITEVESVGVTEVQSNAANNVSGPTEQKVNEILKKISKKTLSMTAIKASSTATWAYSSAISELSEYSDIRVWLEIADGKKEWIELSNSDPAETRVSVYLSSSYNARVQLKWDTTNEKIGLYVQSIGSGWTVGQVVVKRIEGVRMS